MGAKSSGIDVREITRAISGNISENERGSVALRITGFMWLEQYVEKLAWKHGAAPEEVEAVFAVAPRYRFVEKGHVAGENMYAAFGQTDEGRYLIVFLSTSWTVAR